MIGDNMNRPSEQPSIEEVVTVVFASGATRIGPDSSTAVAVPDAPDAD